MTSSNAKKAATPKKASPKKAVVEQPKKAVVEQPKKAVVEQPKKEEKKISNTQACANMIMSLARDAKHTRVQIIESVSEALDALSIVTVRTMMSDLQNAKYAKRYSSHTIAVDKATKIVSVASEIKA